MLRSIGGILAAVALCSCSAGDAASPTREIDRDETIPVHLTVELKGDVTLSFSDVVTSKFIVQRTKSEKQDLQATQVVGTEPVDPIRVGPSAFVAGVAIIPYTGDRRYTIPAGSVYDMIARAQQPGARPEAESSIKVEWWPTGDTAGSTPELFMRRLQPCTVTVAEEGTRGSITCPEVTNEERSRRFSLVMRWKAPKTPEQR